MRIGATPRAQLAMRDDYFVGATLFVRPGRESAFQAYEDKALAIAAEHGAVLQVRLRLGEVAIDAEPFEFHLLRFPTREAFENFRRDERALTLAPERQAVLSRTDVVSGYAISSE